MNSILIISPDIIGTCMAGPGIRYWNIAKQLANYFNIILLIPNKIEDTIELNDQEKIKIDTTNRKTIYKYLKESNIVITQGLIVNKYAELRKKKVPLVIDLYDPFILENLELRKNNKALDKEVRYSMDLSILIEQIKYGDFFLCASEKQKDYWIGFMSALRKINPIIYNDLRISNDLISIIPFGIEKTPLKDNGKSVRNKYGLGEEDTLLVWAGGIWEWMDPFTVVKALDLLKDKNIKCLFMGTKRPGQEDDYAPNVKALIELSNKLELTNKVVFFEEWVPFRGREKYLMAADIGITTYLRNLEGEYSFRTRILDYIWADTPFIITKGDYFAYLADDKKIGLTVEEKKPEELAEKILMLKEDKALYENCKSNILTIKESFYWENNMQGLIQYCTNPYYTRGKMFFPYAIQKYSLLKRQIEIFKPFIKKYIK